MPGAINAHAHGSVVCPLFASAAPPLATERVLANLDYHLRGGTTTVLNLDGFNLPAEIAGSERAHPVTLGPLLGRLLAEEVIRGAVDSRLRKFRADRLAKPSETTLGPP